MVNETPLQAEERIRRLFNTEWSVNASKQRLPVGHEGAQHQFDLFEENRVIGEISTSPWFNKTGSNNSGGQDRVSAGLPWCGTTASVLQEACSKAYR